jgi:hypothetical protein
MSRVCRTSEFKRKAASRLHLIMELSSRFQPPSERVSDSAVLN